LDDVTTHDVIFKTTDGGNVSCHRAVIAAASPVFHAMLYGSMRESHQKEIELFSIDTNSLEHLLKFIYTGQVETNSVNEGLLLAARYFNITALEVKCINAIATSLNHINCCRVAIFATQHCLNELLDKCHKFMKKSLKIDEIIHTPEFKYLPVQSVTEICNSSEIHVKEINLFLAIKEWISYQDPSEEDTIKNILKLIRYPLICADDLMEKVSPTALVDQHLYKEALNYQLSSSCKFKGPADQMKLRQYYFNFCAFYSTGMFIKQDPKGTLITRRKGVSKVCFANIFPK